MAKQPPVTETLGAAAARAQWSQLLNQVHRREKRVVIEKSGIAVAVLISPGELERFSELERRNARAMEVFDRIGEAFADAPLEELESETERALAEVRAEMRAEREALQAVGN